MGSLLRTANSQFSSGLDEAACFERLEGIRVRKQWQARGALALAAAGCVWVVLTPMFKTATPLATADIRAELWNQPASDPSSSGPLASASPLPSAERMGEVPLTAEHTRTLASPAQSELLERAEPPNPVQPSSKRSSTNRAALIPERQELELEAQRRAPAEPPQAAPPSVETKPNGLPHDGTPSAQEPARVTEAACREQSKQGNVASALGCFEQLSRGSDLQAELATYEIARLSAASGRDPVQVLALIDQYQQRFPGGVMLGELDWLRVQSLYKSGRHRAALSESEALLATSAGRVLASDVHWLRGVIFEERMLDFARAASEFVIFVGAPGARGDEGEWRRARCLERLGRRGDAIEAYRHYLERGDARKASEARRKLAELAGPPENDGSERSN